MCWAIWKPWLFESKYNPVNNYIIVLPATENNKFETRTTHSIIQILTNSEVYTNSTLHTAVTTVTSLSFPMYYSSFSLCTSWLIAYCPQWDFEPNSFQIIKSYRFNKWQGSQEKRNCMGNSNFQPDLNKVGKICKKSGWITEHQSYRFKLPQKYP